MPSPDPSPPDADTPDPDTPGPDTPDSDTPDSSSSCTPPAEPARPDLFAPDPDRDGARYGRSADGRPRCGWCAGDAAYVRYHDEEWGVPLRGDRDLFEFLVLETFQAGLSWLTILRKRDAFRRAFDGFDPERVARYGAADVERLLGDAGIVRNRAKILATVRNAGAFLDLAEAEGSYAAWQWGLTDGEPVVNAPRSLAEVPSSTPLSERMARELKARGFAFVGPTVAYAHLQATGQVQDHLVGCWRRDALAGARSGGGAGRPAPHGARRRPR